MVKYKKIYCDALGFDIGDFVPCEISGQRAVDVHHIIGRGKRGEDRIENLMAVTRENHNIYGDKKDYMVLLFKIHRSYLRNNKVQFDNDWFEEKIRMYEN